MAQEELWLRLKADVGDVKKKLGDITAEGNKTTSILGAGFKKLGVIIAGAFTIGAILKFGSDSIRVFTEIEQSAFALGHTLKTMGISEAGLKSLEKAIEHLEVITAFDEVKIIESLNDLILRFGDAEFALKVLPVAMDAARARGRDLALMTTIISMGLQGNVQSLRQFGVVVREGATQLEILEEIKKRVSGATADFSKITAGSVAEMNVSWRNLKEMVGGQVAPVFAGFTKELAVQIGLLTVGIDVNEEYAASWKDIGGGVAKAGIRIAYTIGAIMHLIPELFTGLFKAITELPIIGRMPKFGRGFISELKEMMGEAGESFRGVKTIIEDLQDLWKEEGRWSPPEARKNIGDILAEVNKLSQGLLKLGSEIDKTGDSLAKAFRPAWEPVTLMGGNLPELSRFIGNLRFAQPVVTKKIIMEVNVHDTSRIPTETSRAVVKAIPGAVKGITESHASSFLFGPWR